MAAWENAPIVAPAGRPTASGGAAWQNAPIVTPAPPVDTRLNDRGFGTAVHQGATLGFGDEMRGALGATLDVAFGPYTMDEFGERYRVSRDAEREAYARYREEHPGRAIAGELLGGAAVGIPTGGAALATAPGRAVAANVAARGLPGRLAATSALGAAGGATGGAISGIGEAETLADAPGAAAQGAILGGAAGGLFGPAAELVAAPVRAGANMLRRAYDPQRVATRSLERAAERSGMTLAEARDVARTMGPDATLADVSPAFREALETTTQQPGAARELAERQLRRRSERQASQLIGDLGPGRKYETLDTLAEARRTDASPVYEEAFEAGVPHTSELEEIFEAAEDFAPGLWQQAKRFGRREAGERGQRITEEMLEDQAGRPSLRGWQFMQRRLRGMADRAFRAGDADEGRVIAGLRDRLLGELDRLSPKFKQARGMWADSKSFEDAIEGASRFMTQPAATFERFAKGLSKIDREGMRIGAIQAIEDAVERGGLTHDATKKFRTTAMGRKMRMLFDRDDEFADFVNRLQTLTRQQQTYNAVVGQSATARRLAAQEDAQSWVQQVMDAGTEMLTTGVPTTAPSILSRAARTVGERVPTPTSREAAREATARMLLETDPRARVMGQLSGQAALRAPLPGPTAAGAGRPIVLGGALGTALGTGLLGPQ